MRKEIYSLCFMCSVRCPIQVTVENGKIVWLQGNPHVPGIDGAMCAKGSAGPALQNDTERPQYPMIRTGPRGSGQWKQVTWQEALNFITEKLKEIIRQYGPQSVVWGERANLITDLSKTFMKALGSPNHFTHESLCKGSLNTAFRSLTGYPDTRIGLDYKNTHHIVLYGRNIFESLEIKAVNQLMEALDKGAKMTYLDPRVTVTAAKSHRYLQIRPGTDLAFNYALIHVILKENLYDRDFVSRWISGFKELRTFVAPYTPEWAEKETGIQIQQIIDLAREMSAVKPAGIFHFGYRASHHIHECYFRRSIIILNALMGNIEAKGGLFIKKGLRDVGVKEVRKLAEGDFPKLQAERFDGAGNKKFPIVDPGNGVAQMFPLAVLKGEPYPIKAFFCYRFEPFHSLPDQNLTKKAFEKLDLIVAIEVNYSETAWNADVILPETTYLERTDPVQVVQGLKPQFFLRQQALPPLYNSKPGWEILKGLADRLGIGEHFPFNTIEELLDIQLQDTGVHKEDFQKKGFVDFSNKEIFWDRKEGIEFKTPSGKIELVSSLLEENGFPSFPPYQPVPPPSEGRFRLTVGRCAVHTHGSTENNPYLNELVPENRLWINTQAAQRSGIQDGDLVEVASSQGKERIKALVTDYIHPEAVFMLHGFGRRVPAQTRCLNRGACDAMLQENISDPVGGSPALHHTLVTVRQVMKDT
ncbi:MAG: molybdopterin-dependent oxidoreductase [Candidatus Aquicultor sp.]